MRTLLVLAIGLGSFSGCAGQLPLPTDADAIRAAARWPGTTTASLGEGRSLYVEHCSGCHALHRPAEHTAAEWPAVVQEMIKRAKLDADRADAVIRYLVAMSDAPPVAR